MNYPVADHLIDRTPKSVPMPSAKGHLFTLQFSAWVMAHYQHIKLGDIDGQMYVEITDPVTEMSFQALNIPPKARL